MLLLSIFLAYEVKIIGGVTNQCLPDSIAKDANPTSIHSGPHFKNYWICNCGELFYGDAVEDAILLKQFSHVADWWFQGVADHSKPFAADEYVYKRLGAAVDTDFKEKYFWWLRYKIDETADYTRSSDLAKIQVDFVQFDIVPNADHKKTQIKLKIQEGGVKFADVPDVSVQSTEDLPDSITIDKTDTPRKHEYALTDEDKQYFHAYQDFLKKLKTAMTAKKPFLFPGFGGPVNYFYHPYYIRDVYEYYWKIYQVDTSNSNAVTARLWPPKQHATIFTALTVVPANTQQLKITRSDTALEQYLVFTIQTDAITLHIYDAFTRGYVDQIQIFWEPQHRGECGRHSVNNVIGRRAYTLPQWNEIAIKLNSICSCIAEHCMVTGNEGAQTDVLISALQEYGSTNVEGEPYVQGLEVLYGSDALLVKEKTRWHEIYHEFGKTNIIGYIDGKKGSRGEHWQAFRFYNTGRHYFDDFIVNVNSELKGGPKLRQPFEDFKEDGETFKFFMPASTCDERIYVFKQDTELSEYNWKTLSKPYPQLKVGTAKYYDVGDNYKESNANEYSQLFDKHINDYYKQNSFDSVQYLIVIINAIIIGLIIVLSLLIFLGLFGVFCVFVGLFSGFVALKLEKYIKISSRT